MIWVFLEVFMWYGIGILFGKETKPKLRWFPKIAWLLGLIIIIAEPLIPLDFIPRTYKDSLFINGMSIVAFYLGFFLTKHFLRKTK